MAVVYPRPLMDSYRVHLAISVIYADIPDTEMAVLFRSININPQI
jgi:hypothetical protein